MQVSVASTNSFGCQGHFLILAGDVILIDLPPLIRRTGPTCVCVCVCVCVHMCKNESNCRVWERKDRGIDTAVDPEK